MRVAIIGRSEILYKSAIDISKNGHEISCIITAKEAPEYLKTSKDFRILADKLNVPFHCGSNISLFKNTLKRSNSGIAFSMNYTGIIPQEIINIFKLGILNAHGGDLPKYRGNACQAWAILNGETKMGLCIHKMVGGQLDSGDIIEREYYELTNQTKVTDTWNWMSNRIPNLALKGIEKLNKDPNYYLEKQSKIKSLALRCFPRKPCDGKINWEDSAINILRLVNASNHPYQGAFCFLNDIKLTIWDVDLAVYEENICAVPGQIIYVDKKFVDVACGQGYIRIYEIEYEKNIVKPIKIINSIRMRLR